MGSAETNKKRREKLKLEGLCVVCGKQQRTITSCRCQACSQKVIEQNRDWRRRNPNEAKTIKKNAMKRHRRKIRLKVIALFGGKCECCGENNEFFLHLDHVNNDGYIYRKEKNGNHAIHLDLLKNPNKYKIRVLCANCHNAITYYGNCPHENK